MDLEKLFEEAVIENDSKKLNKFLQLLKNEWVYFFLLETIGRDAPSNTDKVEHIITTGKNNPINIPTINNEDGCNGVIYTNMELALNSA